MRFGTILSAFATLATASHKAATFTVLRFNGHKPLTEGRMDPVVSPGVASHHYHMIQGGYAFDLTIEGDDLLRNSKCTTAKIARDFSNYWVPQLFFAKDGSFQKVSMYYMNVYYFFDKTHDDLVPFPPGLKMLVGDANKRDPPTGYSIQLDPNMPHFNNIQFTCPASNYNAPAYPPDSDGSRAGIPDPQNHGAGVGFPVKKCNGYASPLRQDLHFPSCYNPAFSLDDYRKNMEWPKDVGNGYKDCPEGHIHVPRLFFEVYWNTPEFDEQWIEDGMTQPFVFANGDVTGFSSHADFISGWDPDTLQAIINTCNTGTAGMDTCPLILGGLSTDQNCNLEPQILEPFDFFNAGVHEKFSSLPNNVTLSGWNVGNQAVNDDASSAAHDNSQARKSSSALQLPSSRQFPAHSSAPVATTARELRSTLLKRVRLPLRIGMRQKTVVLLP
ncbi:uncharacterized protein B0I36DRAFT_258195 [Microdochium trichocladiopsis]|uniref:DUF1996 domain-containing protein n=1 Tax=Microdochium trichocladiopsis TaxID=1682393 RepID=A0A9P9BGZ6_9PEZI|nr:uncharacterized protein B0I36DRAFT_258195 [Microdochium trichocladiopsis]KAH7009112.1 hypothetical protein B0I36DRAFT_258195 [Microdochium trichocladiopsis]